MEICRFLVKLQAFCRILTKPEASAIFFTDSGTKPGVRTEARVLHPDGAFYPPLRLRSGAAQSPQGVLLFMLKSDFHFLNYLRHVIMPELVYTILVTLVLYQIILHINRRLEEEEKRSASRFV